MLHEESAQDISQIFTVVHLLLPQQVITAYLAGLWCKALWWLLCKPQSQIASVNINRGLFLWNPTGAEKLQKHQWLICIIGRSCPKRILSNSEGLQTGFLQNLSVQYGQLCDLLKYTSLTLCKVVDSNWMTERNSLKREKEQNSKYRRIGGLNVKHIIAMYYDGWNCEEKILH